MVRGGGRALVVVFVVLVGWRRPWGNDASSPLAVGREYAAVPDGIEPWRRHRHGESDEQRQRIHVDGDGAVAERPFQQQAHEVTVDEPNSILRYGRAQDVLAQRLLASGIGRAGGRRGMERKAMLRSAQASHLELASRAELERIPLVECGPSGRRALDAGAGEPSERGLFVGELLIGDHLLVFDYALAARQAQDARAGDLQHFGDVGVGEGGQWVAS